jgi:Zn-dependent oligopeptidase
VLSADGWGAMDNFTAFRGRQPDIDAMLRHQGMA